MNYNDIKNKIKFHEQVEIDLDESRVMLVVGRLKAVIYESIHDNKLYKHEFKKDVLVMYPKGTRHLILHDLKGKLKYTKEIGITD
jgi:hypothetical protein